VERAVVAGRERSHFAAELEHGLRRAFGVERGVVELAAECGHEVFEAARA
jgi:hypothetical protein